MSSKYPWSEFSSPVLRELVSRDPHDAAFWAADYIRGHALSNQPELIEHMGDGFPGFIDCMRDSFETLSGWLHSPRRIVDISLKSKEMLLSKPPRFYSLPYPKGPCYKYGCMFRFPLDQKDFLFVYAEPTSLSGIMLSAWEKNYREEKGEWFWDYVCINPNSRSPNARYVYNEAGSLRLGRGVSDTRYDLNEIAHAVLNALVALHEEPDVLVGRRKRPKRKSSRAGRVSGVKRLTLSEDGTRLITRRWLYEDEQEEQRERLEREKRKSPGIHHVDQHFWRVWINAPKQHETVLATRERVRKNGEVYTQFRVKRLRGPAAGYARGRGEVAVRESKLVTGIHDL